MVFEKDPTARVMLARGRGTVESPTFNRSARLVHHGTLEVRYALFNGQRGSDRSRCKVDTGAFISILPHHVWIDYDRDIQWEDAPPGQRYVHGFGGYRTPVRWGVVSITFSDQHNSLTQELVAACVTDESARLNPLLGLGGDALRNGGLCIDVDEGGSSWLVQCADEE